MAYDYKDLAELKLDMSVSRQIIDLNSTARRNAFRCATALSKGVYSALSIAPTEAPTRNLPLISDALDAVFLTAANADPEFKPVSLGGTAAPNLGQLLTSLQKGPNG